MLTCGFCNDGALCFRGIDPNTLVDNAQLKLNQAIEWGAQNDLSFSADNTTVVFFSRKYNSFTKVLPKVKKFKMAGVEINPSTCMTYLSYLTKNSTGVYTSKQKSQKLLHF